MPMKAPRICACGHRVAADIRCPCERKADQERKARFDKRRPNSSARGYSRSWEKARAAFLKDHPFCRMCGAPANTVDHITPHKGSARLFNDKSNWQVLCTPCHSRAKQIEERRSNKRIIK